MIAPLIKISANIAFMDESIIHTKGDKRVTNVLKKRFSGDFLLFFTKKRHIGTNRRRTQDPVFYSAVFCAFCMIQAPH